jgi:hypothetical protein
MGSSHPPRYISGSERLSTLWTLTARAAAAHEPSINLAALCRAAVTHLQVSAVAVAVPHVALGSEVIAHAGDLAWAGEDLQITVGEGPSLEALAGAGPFLVRDLAARAEQLRWPLFAPGAVGVGVGSMCALPMRVGVARFGVLAVYLDRVGGLDASGVADAIGFATIALEVLLSTLNNSTSEAREPTDHPEIHQATGMVSLQLEVDMPTALLRLRARAFFEGRLLSALARDVVSRVVRLDDDRDPPPGAAPP